MAVKLSLQKDPVNWPGGEVITSVLPEDLDQEIEGQLRLFKNIKGSTDPIRIMPVERNEAIRLFREHSNASVFLESPLTNREKKKINASVFEEAVAVELNGKIANVQLIMHDKSREHLGHFVAFLKHPTELSSKLLTTPPATSAVVEGRKG